jgi:hypothetical protein
VTGDPLYSLHYTTESARQLGRRQEWWELPRVTVHYLELLTKWPVLVAGVLGVVLALRLQPRRSSVPLVLLAVGVGTFLLVSLRGFSVIYRYLMPAALVLMLFAAFALAGWQLLTPGSRLRTAWAGGAALLVLLAGGFAATNLNTAYVRGELATRESVREQLRVLLAHPEVERGRRCGRVSLPNHKLVPDVRWVLDARAADVVGRTTRPNGGRDDRGVAVYLSGTQRFLKHPAYGPYEQDEDSALIQVPGPRSERVAHTKNFAAYVTC